MHLLYDLTKDLLGLVSPHRNPECICHCPAPGLVHTAECGPLERLLEKQLERDGRAERPTLDFRVTVSLGLFFLVVGFVLGLVVGRCLPGARRGVPVRVDTDESPLNEAAAGLRLARVRGRGIVVRA